MMSPASPPNSAETPLLLVTSLEHGIWPGLHDALQISLKRMHLAHLSVPSMLILHDLVDCAVNEMHGKIFRQLVEADFGMTGEGDEAALDSLYKAEVSEHGSQNIARYCRENNQQVAVCFPLAGEALVIIHSPVAWDHTSLKTARLVGALGYALQASSAEVSGGTYELVLKAHAGHAAATRGVSLLEADAASYSVQQIHEKLGYGLIQFGSAGEIIAVSRSMLDKLKLDEHGGGLAALGAAVPFDFYNDIVWGQALAGENGVFENYRIRMRMPGEAQASVLFNVSGYRDEQAVIHSLWQVVSLADDAASLGVGSILSEARIHNITRNYVPQLVEEKAREAVRLGKDKLTNEECSVAVLFCDIVGFTSYVESNASSESIINTLNTILRRASSSVKRFGGSIDKFMGDSVMAIFRDPADALLAALDMQSHSADINRLRSRAGQDTLRLRIGIHWGEVVIGNVGTAERLDWTAIGDVVNTASRIEKNCKPGAILISQTLRNSLSSSRASQFKFGEIFYLTVKGKREALAVCHISHPDGHTVI